MNNNNVTEVVTDKRQAGKPATPYKRRRGGRLFNHGELRLLLLAMVADSPSHGYDLIKSIERRFGGYYTPSPGVVYPSLSRLQEHNYVALDSKEGGRKRYKITAEGKSFLKANHADVASVLSRAAPVSGNHPPVPVVRAMDNLKAALRLRLKTGALTDQTVENMAAAINNAAKQVEEQLGRADAADAEPQHCVFRMNTSEAGGCVDWLCGHFEYKRPVSRDGNTGTIVFPVGECELQADDGTLIVNLTAPDKTLLTELQETVERHLLRVPGERPDSVDWQLM